MTICRHDLSRWQCRVCWWSQGQALPANEHGAAKTLGRIVHVGEKWWPELADKPNAKDFRY